MDLALDLNGLEQILGQAFGSSLIVAIFGLEQIKPSFAEARYSLGLAYAAIGDMTATLEQYKMLATSNPNLANRLFGEITKETK